MTTALADQIARFRGALLPEGAGPLRELLPVFSFHAAALEGLWEVVGKLTDAAIEARKLTLAVKEALASADEVGGLLTRAREAADGDPSGAADLAKLDACARRVEKVRDDFRSLLRWLTAALPPVDVATVERAKKGTTEGLDDILARLRAGGDL
jgi:hypothetical protein